MRRKCFAYLLLALVPWAPLAASTFIAMSPGELVDAADFVVEGTITSLESFWNEDGRVIVTEAELAVFDAIVGQPSLRLIVRIPGGTVGGFTVKAAGFPAFALGERVVLFLRMDASGHFHQIVGHQQGHFEVVERLDGVTLAVPRVEDGARFFTLSGELAPAANSLELGAFKRGIRELGQRAGRVVDGGVRR